MRRLARPLLALAAAAVLGACASSSAFRAGEKAERQRDYTQAALEYSRALKLQPANLTYRKSLERARLRAAEQHAETGRRLAERGLFKEATDELRLALDLAPQSSAIAADLQTVETRKRAASAPPVRRETTRDSGLPGLELPAAAHEPLGLSFHGASLRDTYLALGQAVGVNFIFDPQFQDVPVDLDLRDVPFTDALRALAHVGRTFHAVVGSKVVTVVPDNAGKRKEYDQQVVKTIFLSNADPRQAADLLRVALGARRVAPVADANAITITDSPDKVAAAEHILGIIDKRRAEVVVEVELLEVNRSRLQDFGVEITSGVQGVGGVAGGIFPRTGLTLGDSPYDKDNLLISNMPGVIYRLLKNDASTRLLANPKLRTSEGQTAQARFGDQIPVPVTTFIPLAAGTVNQQPITSFEYKNVGVNIDITPRVHDEGDVTLDLKLEISSLSASIPVAGVQELPTFNSRSVTNRIRLHDGETSILAGLISDTERNSLTGIPGLSDLPLIGHLFSRNRREVSQTDIVMTLRPHIVAKPEITDADRRAFPLSNEAPPLLFDVPSMPATSPTSRPPDTTSPRVEPIRPPAASTTPTPYPSR